MSGDEVDSNRRAGPAARASWALGKADEYRANNEALVTRAEKWLLLAVA